MSQRSAPSTASRSRPGSGRNGVSAAHCCFLRSAALTALLVGVLAANAATAQNSGASRGAAVPVTNNGSPNRSMLPTPVAGSKMLLEADQLIYDYDKGVVSAIGHVQVYYGGYSLRAERLAYNRKTSRLIASGNVRLTEPGGNVVTAESVDVTDDFRDGFVAELRVETIDKTYFAAQNAERLDGNRTVIRRGVYTACEPCRDKPEKPPLWQIKAGKIIIDETEHVITFESARFEFLGVPIAWVPVFWTPDNTVKRKSGILAPNISFSDSLGFGLGVPYFWAIAPDRDITFSPAYYSKQGFLAAAEWRQRMSTGVYTFAAAGIAQHNPDTFISGSGADQSGTYADRTLRGGIRTTGVFQPTSNWNYGWDVTLMSDRTFGRNYNVLNNEAGIVTSQAYLTGLYDRNYFDARFYQFTVTTDRNPGYVDPDITHYTYPNAPFDQGRQAWVHPVIDQKIVFAQSILGGEVTMRNNLTSLTRRESDSFDLNGDLTDDHTRGAAGTFTRASTQFDWRRQVIGTAGTVVTPFAYVRGDAFALNSTDSADQGLGLTTASAVVRAMPAIGVEIRWPWMATTGEATHVIEPIGQIVIRPNESYAGRLPNEDAQSLVFDDTTLFKLDKFSGYDRVEGGSRVNLGLQYVGRFANGMSIEAMIGQSYQIAGQNSFATYDLAGTTSSYSALTNGTLTGLERWNSDIVSRVTIDGGSGYRLTGRGRFDGNNFGLNRGEIEAAGPIGPVTFSTSLVYLRNLKSLTSGTESSYVVRAAASTTIRDNWRVYGSAVFDLQHKTFVGTSIGLAYDDDCLTVSVAFNEVRENYTDIVPSREVWLKVQLRTLGDAVIATDLNTKTQ